ncbi:MAG: DUF433 domain-containing protein, partial [Chloroflexota bacterium]
MGSQIAYNLIMPTKKTSHPHVVKNPEIANGKPIITGTRIRVVQIVLEHERLNWSPDEIVD